MEKQNYPLHEQLSPKQDINTFQDSESIMEEKTESI